MSIGKTEVGTTTVPARRPFGSLIPCGGTIGRVDGRIPSSIRSTVSDHNHVGWRLDEGFGRLTIPGFLTVRLQVSTKSLIRFDEFVDTTPVVIAVAETGVGSEFHGTTLGTRGPIHSIGIIVLWLFAGAIPHLKIAGETRK